jgi:hypothetical protein
MGVHFDAVFETPPGNALFPLDCLAGGGVRFACATAAVALWDRSRLEETLTPFNIKFNPT